MALHVDKAAAGFGLEPADAGQARAHRGFAEAAQLAELARVAPRDQIERLGGQTGAIPGSYTQVYQNGDTAVTINDVQGSTAPAGCDSAQTGNYFPFTVSAAVVKRCLVNAATDIDLNTVSASATNISGNGNISITCSNTTPYNVGLLPSNGHTGGTGAMSGTGGNTDKVPYQLYQNAGYSTVWGNTATASSTGNGIAGTGTGAARSHTVYVRAPSADYTPGSYSDTVTVNVNY